MRGAASTPVPAPAASASARPSTSGPPPAAGLRRLATLVAAGLFLAPLAPWYAQSVTAPGVHGTRRIVTSQSGWQSLGLTPLACAIVGLCVVALLALRGRARVDGLGAAGRRAARARVDGMLVAAGGALCLVLLLGTLAHHPGPAVTLAGATSAASLGSGVALAALLALALVTAGVAITRTAALAEHTARPARPAGPAGPARPADPADPAGAADPAGPAEPARPADAGDAGGPGTERGGRAHGAADDLPAPEFDFALSPRRAAARRRTAPSRSR